MYAMEYAGQECKISLLNDSNFWPHSLIFATPNLFSADSPRQGGVSIGKNEFLN
jgi:hypothetical protein